MLVPGRNEVVWITGSPTGLAQLGVVPDSVAPFSFEALGDLDDDGFADFAVDSRVFSGSASGPTLVAQLPGQVGAAGDVNGDDLDDAVTTSSFGGTVSVYHAFADLDGDGVVAGEDCDDGDPLRAPGAVEVVADEIDQDCDGGESCLVDADADGARGDGIVASGDEDCADPGEATAARPAGDCADGDVTVFPGAIEGVGDGVDQDCDGREICWRDADGDGAHAGIEQPSADLDCDDAFELGATAPAGDCDDASAAVSPAATERVGNGVDDDCDGAEACAVDADGDGFRTDGVVASTDLACDGPGEAASDAPDGDCDDADDAVHPGADEGTGDGVDADCDGLEVCFVDADGDGVRTAAVRRVADAGCTTEGLAAAEVPDGDCDDTRADTFPGASDPAGDGIDQDCDGADGAPPDPTTPREEEPGGCGCATGAPAGSWLVLGLALLAACGSRGTRGAEVTRSSPRSTMSARFDAAGAHVTGRDGALDVAFTAWGRGSALVAPPRVDPTEGRGRVEWDHGDVTAWWTSDAERLEHGFTVHQPPSGDGPLRFRMVVSGRVARSGDGLAVTAPGGAPFRYGAPRAVDAAGRSLPAELVVLADGLELRVDDAGAVAPIEVDPYLWPDGASVRYDGLAWQETRPVHAGDVDGDGLGDVVLWNQNNQFAGLMLYLGGGLATNIPIQVRDGISLIDDPSRAAAGDLDDDGFDDLVLVQRSSLEIFWGSAAGLRGTDTRVLTPRLGAASTLGLATGDWNGDGVADLAWTDTFELQVWYGGAGGPSGAADARIALGGADGPSAAGLGDVDGDGFDDVGVTSMSGLSAVYVLRGSATGLGAPDPALALPFATNRVAPAGDLDGDGLADVLMVGSRRVDVHHGTPAGLDPAAAVSLGFGATGPDAVVGVGDLDGDGYDDVAVDEFTSLGQPYLTTVFYGSSAGLADGRTILDGYLTVSAPGDVNGDGRADLLVNEVDSCALWLGWPDVDEDGAALGGRSSPDCDDTDASVAPGATELAGDGIDQDCDGLESCYADRDGDGAAGGGLYPSADDDCTDPGESTDARGADCDDTDPTVFAGAVDTPDDGIDQDCDGFQACHADGDGDGYRGDASVPSVDDDCRDAGEAAADAPAGDCDDDDSQVRPGAVELPDDGVDQDCDGVEVCFADADGDGWSPRQVVVGSTDLDCDDPGEADGSVPPGDCDDADPGANPDAEELVGDGVDGDCDGGERCWRDADGDGFHGDAATDGPLDCRGPDTVSDVVPGGDCVDDDRAVRPDAIELCNGLDDDCDGAVDGPFAADVVLGYRDADGDGFGNASAPVQDCALPADSVPAGAAFDCDDEAAAVFPGAPEVVADGVDQDCDGADPEADEGGGGCGCDAAPTAPSALGLVALALAAVRRRAAPPTPRAAQGAAVAPPSGCGSARTVEGDRWRGGPLRTEVVGAIYSIRVRAVHESHTR